MKFTPLPNCGNSGPAPGDMPIDNADDLVSAARSVLGVTPDYRVYMSLTPRPNGRSVVSIENFGSIGTVDGINWPPFYDSAVGMGQP